MLHTFNNRRLTPSTLLAAFFLPAVLLILQGCTPTGGEYRALSTGQQLESALYDEASDEAVALEEAGWLEGKPKRPTKRYLVRTGELDLIVDDVMETADEVQKLAETYDGYIETRRDREESRSFMRMRVPEERLDDFLRELETMGEVESRRVTARDVTEEYVDLKSRLETQRALRDRLQKLLERAEKVEEVLRVERELGRLQQEIESKEARFRTLVKMTSLSQVDLELKRQKILGPIGYVFKYTFWTIGKLFVIRE